MKNQLFLRGNRKPQNVLMSVVFLSLFMLVAAFMAGCDKDAPLGVDKHSNLESQNEQAKKLPSVTMDLEAAKFSLNGKLFTKEEFQRMTKDVEPLIIVAGTGLPETNVVYAFDSEAAFNDWAKTTQFADKFVQMLQHTSDTSVRKTLGSGGWAKLYDGNFSGTTPGKYSSPTNKPSLGTFDNKTSSVDVYAGSSKTSCALYQNSNYGGRKLILTNALSGWLVRFDQSVLVYYSFNNITSSVKVY
jgi:hypothetical protein